MHLQKTLPSSPLIKSNVCFTVPTNLYQPWDHEPAKMNLKLQVAWLLNLAWIKHWINNRFNKGGTPQAVSRSFILSSPIPQIGRIQGNIVDPWPQRWLNGSIMALHFWKVMSFIGDPVLFVWKEVRRNTNKSSKYGLKRPFIVHWLKKAFNDCGIDVTALRSTVHSNLYYHILSVLSYKCIILSLFLL